MPCCIVCCVSCALVCRGCKAHLGWVGRCGLLGARRLRRPHALLLPHLLRELHAPGQCWRQRLVVLQTPRGLPRRLLTLHHARLYRLAGFGGACCLPAALASSGPATGNAQLAQPWC